MDLNFNIDFDTEEINIIVDHSLTLIVIKDGDKYEYKNFHKLNDEEFKNKLKNITTILFLLGQC